MNCCWNLLIFLLPHSIDNLFIVGNTFFIDNLSYFPLNSSSNHPAYCVFLSSYRIFWLLLFFIKLTFICVNYWLKSKLFNIFLVLNLIGCFVLSPLCRLLSSFFIKHVRSFVSCEVIFKSCIIISIKQHILAVIIIYWVFVVIEVYWFISLR